MSATEKEDSMADANAHDDLSHGVSRTPPASMVEIVASAIRRRREFGPLEDLFKDMEEIDREYARAAIIAMREPAEAMLNGARDWSVAKYGIGVGNDAATGCWQAMIAEALK